MKKEIIICTIVIILVSIGDILTYQYAKKCIEEASMQLKELKEDLKEENSDSNFIENKLYKILDNWYNKHQKLAYFIEHDELEKVETSLSKIKGNIEVKEYEEAIVEIEVTDYILEHIKNKTIFSMQNIF